ncbi:MAG TPA: M28 family peptidase, partial [Anaerolineales bacterium]|nr:M28 family peptidase [Anaerolineales bacterium]
YRHSMIDDHTPFLEAGMPAIDIIDFDYPYWHTTQDTPDKVSAESLEIVGKTLWTWVTQQSAQP